MDCIVTNINDHIGRRIRGLRVLGGKSQENLGAVLGLTFQQVQKYERGMNRISAERLWVVAQHFGVDLNYFVDGLDAPIALPGEGDAPAAAPAVGQNSRLRLEIARALQRINSPKLLRGILVLVRAMLDRGEPDQPE